MKNNNKYYPKTLIPLYKDTNLPEISINTLSRGDVKIRRISRRITMIFSWFTPLIDKDAMILSTIIIP